MKDKKSKKHRIVESSSSSSDSSSNSSSRSRSRSRNKKKGNDTLIANQIAKNYFLKKNIIE